MGKVISTQEDDIVNRIFAWSFRVAEAAGLRWGDLLNTPPNTLTLNTEGLIGFAAKTKSRGWLKEDLGELLITLSLTKNGC